MAFAYTIDNRSHSAGQTCVLGTFTFTGSSTTGSINTGLMTVNDISIQPVGVTTTATFTIGGSWPLVATDGAIALTACTTGLTGTFSASGI